ncbi:anti-sigma factor family protein [Granulicoccus phenolivorans]|uniref:anti-sigma factor family protein n=1 Tax=Granulicoccus phenolivorans TaxID=266854 RepID=UPI00040683A9|nr:zf-HC2 domain-containing protein [Granulicoccus phenolivorans]
MTDLPRTHPEPDDLVALALADLGPERRAELSAHLAGCARCRAEYAGLEEAVQLTLPAAPAVAPPAGFSGRVLARLGLPEAAEAAPAPVIPLRRRRLWVGVAAAVAALVVGLGLGIGGTLIVARPGPAPAPTVAPAAASASSAVALLDHSGTIIGTAGRVRVAGTDQLLVTVLRARPGVAYDCVLVTPDGVRHSGGSWALQASAGQETASGTWLVDLPAGGVRRVELLTGSGTLWAHGEF